MVAIEEQSVTKQPRLPSFEDHVEYANAPIQPVLVYLRGRIKALGRMGEKVTANKRIAYDVERDFCEVKVQKERILVRVFDMGVSDPKGIVTDVPRSHDWTYEKQIPVDSNELVDYAIPFIAASYRSSRASQPRR
jgi:predicted transport protein